MKLQGKRWKIILNLMRMLSWKLAWKPDKEDTSWSLQKQLRVGLPVSNQQKIKLLLVWSRFTRLLRRCHLLTLREKAFKPDSFCYQTGWHFKDAILRSIMYPFCWSLRGNKIEKLPVGVFSNNNKLLTLWVGRLKVHSRPTYFHCKILLQTLNSC